ncbi:MAG: hypothetical protein IJE15_01190 [Bacteroidaceae bacterium]|nr:hypothetical protein [Bacteroidaceae bacterium]
MDKKTYIAPAMEIANIETVEMMATSGLNMYDTESVNTSDDGASARSRSPWLMGQPMGER